MAEKKIVGFEIEITGQKEILTTIKLMGLLNTQLILVAGSLAEVYSNAGTAERQLLKFGTTAERAGKAIKGSFKTFEEGNKTVKNLGNGYLEVKKSVAKAAKELKGIKEEEKKVSKVKKKLNELTNKELIQREKLKIVNKERVQIAKQNAILQGKELGQIEKLRAKLALTTISWKKLTKEELENTKKGKALVATKKSLTNQLKKLEKQTGDTRRNVGNYTQSLGKLGKVAASVFVGRSLVDGFRKIAAGLGRLIEKNKESNKSAQSLSKSFSRVTAILEKLGVFIIEIVAGPLKAIIGGFEFFSKSILGIDLSAKKASEGVRDLKNEFNAEIEVLKQGNLSQEARALLIESINKKYKEYLPNLLTEQSTIEEITAAQVAGNKAFEQKILQLATEEQFIEIIKRKSELLTEQVRLASELNTAQKRQAAFSTEEARRLAREAGAGREAELRATAAADKAKQRIESNKILLEQIAKEREILEGVVKIQGFDISKFGTEEQKKVLKEAEEAADEARKKSRAKATTAAKKSEDDRIKALKAARKKALEEVENNSLARLAILNELSKKLKALEIQGIKDSTEKQIEQEKFSFEQRQKARKKGFDDLVNETVKEEARLQALFGFGSAQHLEFTKQSEAQILEVQKSFNKLSEEDERQHFVKLQNIRKSAAAVALQEEIDFFEEEQAELTEGEKRITAALAKTKADRIKTEEEEAEAKKERIRQTTEAIISAVNTTIQAISDISALAFAAENERFEQAIESRKNNISKLNEDLQTATGLQKKFLLQQVTQEEEALKKETENREKARKKQAETQKSISIIQAIIAGALGISNAFAGLPPPASFIAAAATALITGVQIATIASQKFAEGGILSGPAHSKGGIKTAFGELEGGEAVINKRSTKLFRPILSALNRAGGGRSFAEGGILGAPISAPLSISSAVSINDNFNQFLQATAETTAAINNRIDKITVVQDLNNLQDIQDNDNTLNTLTTF